MDQAGHHVSYKLAVQFWISRIKFCTELAAQSHARTALRITLAPCCPPQISQDLPETHLFESLLVLRGQLEIEPFGSSIAVSSCHWRRPSNLRNSCLSRSLV